MKAAAPASTHPYAVAPAAALQTVWLRRVPYLRALDLQRRIHARRVAGAISDTVLLLEHDHVITTGRRSTASDVLASPDVLSRLGVEVAETDRGGQTTYHGPGQLVGYPIVDIKVAGLGPVTYVRLLERTVIETLGLFGVEAFRVDGQTGVWAAGGKIAAIGVRISSGVTMHGFALNVSTDLRFFGHIVPCGMPSAPVASVWSEKGTAPGLGDVASVWAERFAAALGMSAVRVEAEALGAQ
jgi:lipoyl(octanoyl) transferase